MNIINAASAIHIINKYIKEMLDRQAQGLPGLGFAAEAGSV